MKSLIGLVCCLCLVSKAQATVIMMKPTDLGGGRWQCDYTVKNDTLPQPISEFRIWYDKDLYGNLAANTPKPLALVWDQLVMQPDPMLDDDGAYDALSLAGGIDPGETVGQFVVSFDWHGPGQPGPQPFDILDAQTFEVIDSGQTVVVPEPTTILLLGVALAGLAARLR
jgi:hypothetical protein